MSLYDSEKAIAYGMLTLFIVAMMFFTVVIPKEWNVSEGLKILFLVFQFFVYIITIFLVKEIE